MEQVMPNYSVFIQAVIFLVALYVIKSFILAPITEVLKGRSEQIEGSEQEAQRFEAESARLDASYRAKIADARSQAQQERAKRREEARGVEREILGKGREEAQVILEGIRSEIQQESTEARGRLRAEAAGLDATVNVDSVTVNWDSTTNSVDSFDVLVENASAVMLPFFEARYQPTAVILGWGACPVPPGARTWRSSPTCVLTPRVSPARRWKAWSAWGTNGAWTTSTVTRQGRALWCGAKSGNWRAVWLNWRSWIR